MARFLRISHVVWVIPRLCDVCRQSMDVGYQVLSDDGTRGDVCGACLGRPVRLRTSPGVAGRKEGKGTMTRTRYTTSKGMGYQYVGIRADTYQYERFQAWGTPTPESHGALYIAVIGPFKTVRGARYMAKRKRGCYRCGSRCHVLGCRVCAGKVLCHHCRPGYLLRDEADQQPHA